MSPVPDPSPTAQDFPNLEAGLAALQQGDYKTAIAQLESIPLLPEHALTAKAQMGLVAAYARTGTAVTCRSAVSNTASKRSCSTPRLGRAIAGESDRTSPRAGRPA